MSRPVLALSHASVTLLLVVMGGCLAPPEPVTLVLVNETTLDVRPNLHTSADATTADELFQPANLNTTFTDRAFPELRPGETISLSFECADLQSVGVDRPVLFDAAALVVTPSEDTLFRVRETDFACGDTVRFVFFSEGEAFRVRVE
jgi:hypothetical protein